MRYLFLLLFPLVLKAGDGVVGKPCPDFRFDTVLQHSQFSVAEMKGKYMILDFWGTFCIPCIAAIPKLEKIQSAYVSKLEILMVVTDGFAKAVDFYETRKKYGKPISLPTAACRAAVDYFGVVEVPRYVWIDSAGIVVAVSGAEQMTEENVLSFLSGRALQVPVQVAKLKLNHDLPLRETVTDLQYDMRFSVDSSGVSLASLFSTAYGERVSVADSLRYTYVLVLPVDREPHRQRFMREDLLRFTGFRVVRRKGVLVAE